MALKWRPNRQDIPAIAYLLTKFAMALNPEIVDQTTLEQIEDMLYIERPLGPDDFIELAAGLNREKFDPDYDWWQ